MQSCLTCFLGSGIEFIRIDGSTSPPVRQERVNLFQTNASYRVALLSLTAASTGLTLTAADSVKNDAHEKKKKFHLF